MHIYGVHPADKDLNFLTKLNEEFSERFKGSFGYLRLEADYKSHEDCISTLKKNENALLLFFCHALDKTIRGCKIEHAASSKSHKDFNYGPLISPTNNIEVFKGKNVFCLACNSRDLGPYAIKSGALVFIGFGDIPFYITENFKEDKIGAAVKRELSAIVSNSLIIAIENNHSFNKLSNHLMLSFDKKIFELLKDKTSGTKIRKEVARVLSRVKNGITMFGNGNLKIRSF